MIIDVQEKVSKESYELGMGLVKFLKALRQATQDGWQPIQDMPAILQSAIGDLVPAMSGVEQVLNGTELSENEKAFVTAWLLMAKEAVYVFKK